MTATITRFPRLRALDTPDPDFQAALDQLVDRLEMGQQAAALLRDCRIALAVSTDPIDRALVERIDRLAARWEAWREMKEGS